METKALDKIKPLVSIIMGIYNCAETLEEAVGCIINQTYRNWELIMCDDGSKDNTYELACEIAKNDSRIVVLKNEKNMTLAPTLNKCASFAKGDYLARMDGDDLCNRTRLEKEMAIMLAHPEYAIVSSWMETFDENGAYGRVETLERPVGRNFIYSSQFAHAACIMRKEVFEAVGGYEISSRRERVEDYDLWIRMYQAGYSGYNLQEVLYSMRDDKNAKRRRNFKNRRNEMLVKIQACSLYGEKFSDYIQPLLPLIKYLTPDFIYHILHAKRLS